MLNQIVAFCTSYTGLFWLGFYSDLAIALAYFAIPITMAVVLRHRKEDILYPWLWLLFVVFIVACGMTHVAHVWSAVTGLDYPKMQTAITIFTAIASVVTAIAFALVLPQIKNLPSPRQQKAQLEKLVAERSHEKDRLIREINHRIGNQLQVISSAVSIELRRAKEKETVDVLQRLRVQLVAMAKQHRERSNQDYLEAGIQVAATDGAPGAPDKVMIPAAAHGDG